MNIVRMILAALAVAVFCALFGMATCGWLFKWVYALPPTEIWRPMDLMPAGYWLLINFGTFLIAMIYTMAYARVGCCFSHGIVKRGLFFGFFIWLVSMVPGMFYTYAFMNIAGTVVIYWLIRGLVEMLVSGLLIALIYPLPNGCQKSVG